MTTPITIDTAAGGAALCPFSIGKRTCVRELDHRGVHFDGEWNHNTPDTWPAAKAGSKR